MPLVLDPFPGGGGRCARRVQQDEASFSRKHRNRNYYGSFQVVKDSASFSKRDNKHTITVSKLKKLHA